MRKTSIILWIFILIYLFSLPLRTYAMEEVSPGAWAALQNKIDRAEDGDVITLTENAAAGPSDRTLFIKDGISLILDLNGYTLDRGMGEAEEEHTAYVIQIPEKSSLIIRDSSGGSGRITGGLATDGGGIINRGTLIVEGGCITGNRALETGGAIFNLNTLIISGGTVTGNTAGIRGGGVFNNMLASMTAKDGLIRDNSAPKDTDIGNDGTMSIIGEKPEKIAAIRDYVEVLSLFPALSLLIALAFAVTIDSYLNAKQKRTLYIIILTVLGLIVQGFLDYRMSLPDEKNSWRTAVAILGYILRPAILAMFLNIIQPERRFRGVWALITVNTAVYLTGFFSHLPFHISINNHFHEGPLHLTCPVISAVLFIYLLRLTVRAFHPRRQKETLILLFPLVLLILAFILDQTLVYYDQPVSLTTEAITISSMLYYIWLHLQFVRNHEKDLQAEQRIQIMMTQIRPHFLYNTLMTIQALCRKDPQKAYDTIGNFSLYLRQNIDTLDQSDLIPVEKELEHAKAYAEIEKLRFSSFQMQYVIEDTDFLLPPLTVQPMVENAIRHGVYKKKDGVVRLETRRTAHFHEILISDNGAGFDPEKVNTADRQHIGIRNVRERIEKMCRGSLSIESREGEGTTVIIRIPE